MQIEAFSNEVNKSAREHYRMLCEQTGVPVPKYKPIWLALREETPYPYSFYQRDSMLPTEGTGFGGVIIKDRNSGLREIHDTIDQVSDEHSWIYIPDNSVWIDTTQGVQTGTAISDQYLVTFLSYMYPIIEMTHSHPDKVAEELFKEGIYRLTPNYLIEIAKPSDNDLIRHQQLHVRNNPNSHLVTTVVSHYGAASFELNEVGKRSRGSEGHRIEYAVAKNRDPIDEVLKVLEACRQSRTTFSFKEPGQPIFDYSFTQLP